MDLEGHAREHEIAAGETVYMGVHRGRREEGGA